MIGARRPMIFADISKTGQLENGKGRIDVASAAYITIQAVRRGGTATTGEITFKRANDRSVPGVAYATAQTLALNADNLMSNSIDVRDHADFVIEVSTTAAAQFELYPYLTPLV